MTREELIKAINDNEEKWSCPIAHCEIPEKEGNTGACCIKCAEEQLKAYEATVHLQGFEEGYSYAMDILSGTSVAYEFMNSEKDKARYEGRRDAVNWIRKLIKIFWRDWNKQSHKRLSNYAFEELDEWILEQADETNGRVFMEQIKTIDSSNLYNK